MMTTTHNSTRRTPRALGIIALASIVAIGTGGCRGDRSEKPPRQFFPDMDDQLKWKPQSQSDFFADGRTMRLPVKGTVAFGRTSVVSDEAWADTYMTQRSDLLRNDDSFYRGVDESGAYVVRMPVQPSRAMVERGMERFDIFCAACHGYEGDSKGTVGNRWSYPVANFHDPKYRDTSVNTGKDGYLFHIVRNGVIGGDGKLKMPGYAHAVNEQDAWAIVAYMRALQASRLATLDDVPTTERSILERQRTGASINANPSTAIAAEGAK